MHLDNWIQPDQGHQCLEKISYCWISCRCHVALLGELWECQPPHVCFLQTLGWHHYFVYNLRLMWLFCTRAMPSRCTDKCTLIHLLEKIGNEGELEHDQWQTKEVSKYRWYQESLMWEYCKSLLLQEDKHISCYVCLLRSWYVCKNSWRLFESWKWRYWCPTAALIGRELSKWASADSISFIRVWCLLPVLKIFRSRAF